MFRNHIAILLLTAALAVPSGAAQSDSGAEVRLQAAINVETVEGDLGKAIELYEELADSSDRAVAAQALVRLGQCHEKLGDAEARTAYERAIRDFADQAGAVQVARARLAALGQPDNGEPTTRRLWTMYGNWRMGPVSLDGRYHAYTVGEGLVVRDLRTGDVRRIDGIQNEDEDYVFDAVVSPDNKQIAFGGMMGGRWQELLVVGTDGTPPRTIFRTFIDNNVSWVIPTGWTPDGKEVLVTFNRDSQPAYHVGMISVETGNLRVLKEFDSPTLGTANISPDGRWVAYDVQRTPGALESDIYVMRSDGTDDHILVDHPAGNFDPYWTADSRGVVFRSDRRGSMDAWFVPVVDGQAGDQAVMIKADVPGSLRGVSGDGTLFYEANASTYQVHGVTLDQLTGRALSAPELVPVTYSGQVRSPVLSPDGEWLAYSRQDSTIVLQSLASRQERELKHGKPGNGDIAWYPDGKALVLFGRDSDGTGGIWRVDVATGSASLLYHRFAMNDTNMGFRVPTVAPDGRTFYVRASGSGDSDGATAIFAVDSETNDFREVTRFTETSVGGRPMVSPDGRRIAVTFTDQGTDNRQGLRVIDTQTGDSRVLCDTHGQTEIGGWTPDSRYVVIATGTEADPDQVELWRVPLDGGDIVKSPLSERFSDGFGLGPQMNGTHLVWTTGKLTREVWAVDNVLPEAQ